MRDTFQFKNILVATDFSENSVLGLDWAIQIAKAHSASIHLTHALPSEIWMELQDKITENLEILEARCAQQGVTASSGIGQGRVETVVTEVANQIDVDLIVVGARGHTGLKRFMLGSNAEKIVRTVQQPTLTVHPEHALPGGPIDRILVATDFSKASQLAAKAGIAFAEPLAKKLEVVLLHAWQPVVFYGVDYAYGIPVTSPDDTSEVAEKHLHEHASKLKSDSIEIQPILKCETAARAIMETAEEHEVQMVVVGTHGRSGIDRFVTGSIAERIIRHAPAPVFCLRTLFAEESDINVTSID